MPHRCEKNIQNMHLRFVVIHTCAEPCRCTRLFQNQAAASHFSSFVAALMKLAFIRLCVMTPVLPLPVGVQLCLVPLSPAVSTHAAFRAAMAALDHVTPPQPWCLSRKSKQINADLCLMCSYASCSQPTAEGDSGGPGPGPESAQLSLGWFLFRVRVNDANV